MINPPMYSQKQAHRFDTYWDGYNDCSYQLLKQLLPAISPQNILDIGTGTGNGLGILKQVYPAADVLGIDPSLPMLQKARNKHPDCQFSVGDIYSQKAKTYDLITAISMFHYVKRPKEWMQKVSSLLSNNGIAIIIDWSRRGLRMCLRNFHLKLRKKIHQTYSETEFTQHLQGWQIQEKKTIKCPNAWYLQGYVLSKSNVRLPYHGDIT